MVELYCGVLVRLGVDESLISVCAKTSKHSFLLWMLKPEIACLPTLTETG